MTLLQDGYVAFPGYLDGQDIDAIAAEFERLVHDEKAVAPLPSANGKHLIAHPRKLSRERYPALFSVLDDARLQKEIGDYFDALYGPGWEDDAWPGFHEQLQIEMNARAGYGSNSMWHFDHHSSVKCAIYIDAVDAGNGAMDVIPGSHRAARREVLRQLALDPEPLMLENGFDDLPDIKPTKLALPAGSVAIFDTLCIHRGGHVREENRRRRTLRGVTWPPRLSRSYLTIEGPDVIDFSKIRLFHTGGGRTGRKTENPCLQFRG